MLELHFCKIFWISITSKEKLVANSRYRNQTVSVSLMDREQKEQSLTLEYSLMVIFVKFSEFVYHPRRNGWLIPPLEIKLSQFSLMGRKLKVSLVLEYCLKIWTEVSSKRTIALFYNSTSWISTKTLFRNKTSRRSHYNRANGLSGNDICRRYLYEKKENLYEVLNATVPLCKETDWGFCSFAAFGFWSAWRICQYYVLVPIVINSCLSK